MPKPIESREAAVIDKQEISTTKLSYATVKEVWDKKLYDYTLYKASAAHDIDEYGQYSFVVRNRIERSTLKSIKYMDIKSPTIRDLLAKALRGIRGVSLKEDKPSIELKILLNFASEIREQYVASIGESDENGSDSSHANVLLEYLDKEYHPVKTRLQSLLKDNEITYDLLWTIFKPNADIFTLCPGTGAPRCVRCNFGEERTRNNGTRYFHVEARYLDHDGDMLGEAVIVLPIEEFRGAKRINMLSSYPLVYHQRYEQLKRQLIEHGRSFVSLIGVHHRVYSGKAFYIDQKGNMVIRSVDESRIMVDRTLFRRCNPNYRIKNIETMWGSVDDSYAFQLGYSDDSPVTAVGPLQAVENDVLTMQERDYLICSSTIYGYSLKYKIWLEFAVANTRIIVWDHSSFDNLTIPATRKKAVRALCEAHLRRNPENAFEDFVVGKGKGLIALLHGPPGVGKTLTAETVSEHLRRPFYTVSAGDLGTDPAQLERNLSEIFELSTSWNATLLLDEADIFVEKRSINDLHRNALVCIFLRKLEYYDGILFMTTNRVQTIDEAIASRIHMPLRYDDLNDEARKKVWTSQLRKAVTKTGAPVCSKKNIDDLAQRKLNGREITNATSTAHAMAAFDDEVVNMSYLNDALELNQQFQADFKGAGFFDNQRAYT